MTQAEMRLVLGHLHKLAGGPAPEATDHMLLGRFLDRRDESAFAELLRRHASAVRSICRSVLRHEQDAEDAFQATFLVLARKAGTIRQQRSVGAWLAKVAYHAALRARTKAGRQRAQEREMDDIPASDRALDMTLGELRELLYEELHRLPEHYRAPLVLCYLEGRTHEEAARHLGWSKGAVRGRLNRARERLRSALARRGVALPAGVLCAALTAGPFSAALAPGLVERLARAAGLLAAGRPPAGVVSASAQALAEGVTQAMFMTRGMILGAVLLLAGALAGAGLLACKALAQRPPLPATTGALAAPPAVTRDVRPGKGGEKKGKWVIAGRVLSAEGKPVPGARVAAVGLPHRFYRGEIGDRRHETLAAAQADRKGRFRLELRRNETTPFFYRQVLASAPGHGLAWSGLKGNADKRDLIVRLRAEQTIRGRLLDLSGKPARGVKFHVYSLRPATKAQPAMPLVYGFQDSPRGLAAWPAPLSADDQGRFTLRGLGKDLAVTLLVTDERFARQQLTVQTTAKGKPGAVELPLMPPRVLEGKIVGAGGAAVGKVLLQLTGSTGGPGPDNWAVVHVWSDQRGNFRVACPPGSLGVWALPAEGTVWLGRMLAVTWPRGKVRHRVTITLPRGVRVRGKVTEAPSGKPVAGAVIEYRPFESNPAAHYTVLSWRVGGTERVRTRKDGTFEATVFPGRGHILAKGPSRDFILQRFDAGRLMVGKPGGAPVYLHAVAGLDLKPDARPRPLALTVRRGVTIRGRVLGPDGKPVKRALLLHPRSLYDHRNFALYHHYHVVPLPVRDGRFALTGCDPKAAFPIHIVDPYNRFGAVARVSGKDSAREVTVGLARCGSARLRIVTSKGKPVRGAGPSLQLLLDARADSTVPLYSLGEAKLFSPPSDKEGRITVSTLIPGATYLYFDGKRGHKFTVKSGETRTLPDTVYDR
jgi:RNA polymerase sigma factor (sigma-70 family)